MENQAPYQVAYIATPPTEALTDEAFRQQVLTQARQAGPEYLASTSCSHSPAHTLPCGTPVGTVTYYNVQVWDLTSATLAQPSGSFCFVAQGETAAACLAALTAQFRQLAASQVESELRELAANPTRQNQHQLDSHLALAAAA